MDLGYSFPFRCVRFVYGWVAERSRARVGPVLHLVSQELWTMPWQVLEFIFEGILKLGSEFWRNDIPGLWSSKVKIIDGEEVLVLCVPTVM